MHVITMLAFVNIHVRIHFLQYVHYHPYVILSRICSCYFFYILVVILLTFLVYQIQQKIAKGQIRFRLSCFTLWYERKFLCVYIFPYTHACVKFYVLNRCDML